MSFPLGVAVDRSAGCSGDVASVIASLPVSLRTIGLDADLVAIDGRPGWVGAAVQAIEGGAKGLVVINPVEQDTAKLAGLAELAVGRGVPVVIDWPFAGNPAVPAMAPHFAAAKDLHSLIECRASVTTALHLSVVLLDQFALIGRLVGPIDSAYALDWTAQHYVVSGRVLNGPRIRLTAIRTTAVQPIVTVRMLGPAVSVDLTIPSPATAQPALGVVSTESGAKLLPTLFETAHRFSWRTLIHLVQTRTQGGDLSRFVRDASKTTKLSVTMWPG